MYADCLNKRMFCSVLFDIFFFTFTPVYIVARPHRSNIQFDIQMYLALGPCRHVAILIDKPSYEEAGILSVHQSNTCLRFTPSLMHRIQ